MERPKGVTIIAVVLFSGAAFLTLGSMTFFFVGAMSMTSSDAAEPVSVAIAGMGLSGGAVLLVFAGGCIGLAIGLLELRNLARLVCIASVALGLPITMIGFLAQISHPTAMIVTRLFAIGAGVWVLRYFMQPPVKASFGVALDLAKHDPSFFAVTTKIMPLKQTEPASTNDSKNGLAQLDSIDSSRSSQVL